MLKVESNKDNDPRVSFANIRNALPRRKEAGMARACKAYFAGEFILLLAISKV